MLNFSNILKNHKGQANSVVDDKLCSDFQSINMLTAPLRMRFINQGNEIHIR